MLTVRTPYGWEGGGLAVGVLLAVLGGFAQGIGSSLLFFLLTIPSVAGLLVFATCRLLELSREQTLRLGPSELRTWHNDLDRAQLVRINQHHQSLVLHTTDPMGRYETALAIRHAPTEVAALALVIRSWMDEADFGPHRPLIRQADRGDALAKRLHHLDPTITADGVVLPLLVSHMPTIGLAWLFLIVASTFAVLFGAGAVLPSAVVALGLTLWISSREAPTLRLGPDGLDRKRRWRTSWDRVRGCSAAGDQHIVVHTLDGDLHVSVPRDAMALAEVISDLGQWTAHTEAPEQLSKLRSRQTE